MDRFKEKFQSGEESRQSSTIDFWFRRNSKESRTSIAEKLISGKEKETLPIIQALVLSSCVLSLSYYSIRYGRIEYGFLENGQLVGGYRNKAVLTLSLGYSVPYSIVSTLAIGMLIYSLVSKNPRWSLPSIVLNLADLVCDFSDAVVSIWLLFSNFPSETALIYTTGMILLILAEICILLDLLLFYERRTFKLKYF